MFKHNVVWFMLKNKIILKQIIVLIAFAIFTITCLTLVDSATAIAIDSNQDYSDENIESVDEESVEPVSHYSTFQNKANDNESDLTKINVLISNKTSQSDNKTSEEDSTKNIGNINQYENMKIITIKTAKAGENDNNTNLINEYSENSGNEKVVEPTNKTYGMKMQYMEISVVVILLIASFSSFILYLKS